MIDFKQKFIFVHVTKTGGTSVEKALGGKLHDHRVCRKYQSEYGVDIFNHFSSFSIVRNPWDLWVSAFMYMSQNTNHVSHVNSNLWGFWKILKSGWSIGEKIFDKKTGALLVDTALKFENLASDWIGFCEERGITDKNIIYYPIDNMNNETKHKHYSHYYIDQFMIDAVLKRDEHYIKYFNYKTTKN